LDVPARDEEFRRRLAAAIERVGRKAVARADGQKRDDGESVSQGGLTKILNGERANPGIFTIKTIADSAGVTVGELLGETGFDLTAADQEEVRRFVRWADDKLLKAAPPKIDARDVPNSSAIRIVFDDHPKAGRVSKRGAVVARFDPKRQAQELPAAATPNRATFYDGDEELPLREIPTHYYERGARIVRKVEGDSMAGALIGDNDLVFVRPTSDVRSADGEIVVAEVAGSEYVKVLDLSEGRIRLLSMNPEYDPMIVNEDSESFRLIGVVVGRSGYPMKRKERP